MDGRSLPWGFELVNRFIGMKRWITWRARRAGVCDIPAMPYARSLSAAFACALLCTLLFAPSASATKIYRWTGADGVVHYGDHPPDRRQQAHARNVRVIPVRAEPSAVARLRLEPRNGQYLAWADNLLGGPIEVMLDTGPGSHLSAAPALPARTTVAASGSGLVSVLAASSPAGGSVELRLTTVPGDPNARPRDVDYLLPLRQRALHVEQGYGGSFSHTDPQNLYAVDFAADIGTPVLAARDGVVMQVESDFAKAGLNLEKFGGRANFVRILHDDGTMALYAHLQESGVLVRVGQRVRAGQQIGLSGNTGFTTGPHLHFVVQVNRGMRLESIPFRMSGPQGLLNFGSRR
jgi:murein DD-endopeptidase MepM/ murein hydrolase activator NlpD